MKKRKLMLASLLAALCISVVPGSAFAAETGNQTAETEQPQTKAETETETETEPETEAKSGWVKEGGKVYYYVDNKPVQEEDSLRERRRNHRFLRQEDQQEVLSF